MANAIVKLFVYFLILAVIHVKDESTSSCINYSHMNHIGVNHF